MAQNPLLIDQLQIEPGSAGTRLIRKAGDGSLEFLDIRVTGGITLMQLAGLKSMANVMIVGKSGAGAAYTTIQSALDAIPSSSSVSNPYFVFVGPGQYRETLNIVRDGVYIYGFGAVLQSALEATPNAPGATHTIVIQAALGTVPRLVVLKDLEITNAHDGYACVRVYGTTGSNVGATGIRFVNCTLGINGSGGNYPLWATTANIIQVQGGSMMDPYGLGLLRVEECAEVTLQGVLTPPAMSFRWDVANAVPSMVHTGYSVLCCPRLGTGSSLVPRLELQSSVAPNRGNLYLEALSGTTPSVSIFNGLCRAIGCDLGAVTSDAALVYLRGSFYSSLAVASGGKISRDKTTGTEAFAAEATKTVTFTKAMSANYKVLLETDAASVNPGPWIESKTDSGFEIHFAGVETLGVNWVAFHDD